VVVAPHPAGGVRHRRLRLMGTDVVDIAVSLEPYYHLLGGNRGPNGDLPDRKPPALSIPSSTQSTRLHDASGSRTLVTKQPAALDSRFVPLTHHFLGRREQLYGELMSWPHLIPVFSIWASK